MDLNEVNAAAERRRQWQRWQDSDDESTESPYRDRQFSLLGDASTLADAYLEVGGPYPAKENTHALAECYGLDPADTGHRVIPILLARVVELEDAIQWAKGQAGVVAKLVAALKGLEYPDEPERFCDHADFPAEQCPRCSAARSALALVRGGDTTTEGT